MVVGRNMAHTITALWRLSHGNNAQNDSLHHPSPLNTMNRTILISALSVALCSCDGEKAQEAKKQISEASKATAEAAKEMGSKALEKGKEMEHNAVEKGKAMLEKAGTKVQAGIEKGKEVMHDAAPKIKEAIEKGKQAAHDAAPKVHAALEKARAASKAALASLSEKSKPAVERVKAKLQSLSKWYRDTEHQQSKDPAAAKQIFNQLYGELQRVDTTDLPAEVLAPLNQYRTVMEQQNVLMQSMPDKEADINVWLIQNHSKLDALDKAIKPAASTLQAAAAKYGIEGLSFIDDAAAEAQPAPETPVAPDAAVAPAPEPAPAPAAPATEAPAAPAPPAGQ